MSTYERLVDVKYSLKSYARYGTFIALALVVGVGGWVWQAKLAGAVITSGTVVVKSNPKKIQHIDGGIVAEIKVNNGDRVAAGDLLIRLDDTETRSDLAITERQLAEFAVRRARLKAERDNEPEFAVPAELADLATSDEQAEVLNGERRLMKERLASIEGRALQLDQRVEQLEQQIVGLTAQRSAAEKQLEFIHQELKGLSSLKKQGLVKLDKLLRLEREAARLLGTGGQLTSDLAATRVRISETKERKLQLKADARREVVSQLREADAKIAELKQRRIQARARLKRINIVAPQPGVIHDLSVYTVGGVIAPGAPVAFIIPTSDQLVVETRLAPQDVDQVTVGQKATVQLQAFDRQTTPELNATVSYVSADLSQPQDEKTPATFVIRVDIPEAELNRLEGKKLVPGMPADVFVQTGEQTVFEYLAKPFRDQWKRAFREK